MVLGSESLVNCLMACTHDSWTSNCYILDYRPLSVTGTHCTNSLNYRPGAYQFMEASMIPVNCSLSCSRLSFAKIGAKSRTRFWGSIPSTNYSSVPSELRSGRHTLEMSSDLYPTIAKPLGTPTRSKNLQISSLRTIPRSSSLTLLNSLDRSLPMNTEMASRCR